jgi:mgtE-like transporter
MTFYNHKEIIKQSIPILLVASTISVFTGLILQTNLDLILTYPILLLILPSFNNTSGNIASTFTSRLTSKLHLGAIKPKWKQIFLAENVAASILLRITTALALGISAQLVAPFLNVPTIGVFRITLILLLSSLVLEFLMSFTAVLLSFESYKRNLDPNNTTFPLLTSLSDIIGVFILMVISNIVG